MAWLIRILGWAQIEKLESMVISSGLLCNYLEKSILFGLRFVSWWGRSEQQRSSVSPLGETTPSTHGEARPLCTEAAPVYLVLMQGCLEAWDLVPLQSWVAAAADPLPPSQGAGG